MFIGHYGPAVWDTQRGHTVPLVRLWQGFLAVQAMDIVYAVIAMAGHEGPVFIDANTPPALYIPWSHSLLSAVVIAIGAGLIFKLLTRRPGWKSAVVVAALAFSHWPLDWLVHRPDLPLYPGGEKLLGLGLWDYAWATYALEVGLLGTAIAWWLKVTEGPTWTLVASWVLVAVMCAMQFTFLTDVTLMAQAGELSADMMMPNRVFGALTLFVFTLFAGAVWVIERRRVSRFA